MSKDSATLGIGEAQLVVICVCILVGVGVTVGIVLLVDCELDVAWRFLGGSRGRFTVGRGTRRRSRSRRGRRDEHATRRRVQQE